MKKVNHIVLIFSLLVFVGSEVAVSHPFHSIYSMSENRAQSEAEPSTSVFLSTNKSLVGHSIKAKAGTPFIYPFLIKPEHIAEEQYFETKRLFIVHRALLI